MMDLTDPKLQQQFLEIVRLATDDLRSGFNGLRADFKDMQDDIEQIKIVQGQQGMVLRATQSDVNSLKTSYRQQAQEVTKLGVLFEDLDYRFEATAELH